jgi:hypothetical protein
MLVYGSTKKTPIPAFQPHFVIYDKKTLRFSGYFLQNFPDSSTEAQKTRCVNILYYLEDDTITVLEPIVNVRLVYFFDYLQYFISIFS